MKNKTEKKYLTINNPCIKLINKDNQKLKFYFRDTIVQECEEDDILIKFSSPIFMDIPFKISFLMNIYVNLLDMSRTDGNGSLCANIIDDKFVKRMEVYLKDIHINTDENAAGSFTYVFEKQKVYSNSGILDKEKEE